LTSCGILEDLEEIFAPATAYAARLHAMSCLPTSWNTNKRKLNDGNKCTRRAKRAHVSSHGIVHVETVQKAVKESLSALEKHGAVELQDVRIDPLLESIPFVRLLNTIPPASDNGDVVLVTRKYEEQFLRECRSNKERKCVMQMQCECMVLDPAQPFNKFAKYVSLHDKEHFLFSE
jgi:hypothetical protein